MEENEKVKGEANEGNAERLPKDETMAKTEDERGETWKEANEEAELIKKGQKPVTARILASQYAEKVKRWA